MPRTPAPMALLLAALIAAGCSTAAPEADVASKQAQPMEAEGGLAQDALGGAGAESRAAAPPAQSLNEAPPAAKPKAAAPGTEAKKQDSNPTQGMYIIRRASMTLQVPAVRDGVAQVTERVRAAGGFVAGSEYEASEGEAPSATMTLRVPAKAFDRLLDALGGVGTVFARNVESEDVTMEYVDTGSRIRNLKQEEAQLLKLLQRTGKLLDVLEVERELSRVRGEIEQAQGRLRHLGALVDLATIQVTLSEKVKVVSDSPWAALPAAIENAWADANRGLASAITWLMRTGIWLVGYWLPIALPAIALFVLVGVGLQAWLIRRRKLMPEKWFQRFWVGLGVALLAMQWPPLAGLVLLAAIAAAVLGAGAAFVGRFFVRKRELD